MNVAGEGIEDVMAAMIRSDDMLVSDWRWVDEK